MEGSGDHFIGSAGGLLVDVKVSWGSGPTAGRQKASCVKESRLTRRCTGRLFRCAPKPPVSLVGVLKMEER